MFHTTSGFTLIESILYTLLVTMILTGFVLIIQAIFQAQTTLKGETLLHEDLRFALQKIESRLQASSGITYPLSGATSTRLTLTLNEASKNPTTFEQENTQLTFTEGTSPNVSLTSNNIEVTAFTVTHLPTTPSSVRIILSARRKNTPASSNTPITIQETLVIRR